MYKCHCACKVVMCVKRLRRTCWRVRTSMMAWPWARACFTTFAVSSLTCARDTVSQRITAESARLATTAGSKYVFFESDPTGK